MGLRKETTFEAQIKSFIGHYSFQVLDIAVKVSHSPDYDQDVIFEVLYNFLIDLIDLVKKIAIEITTSILMDLQT